MSETSPQLRGFGAVGKSFRSIGSQLKQKQKDIFKKSDDASGGTVLPNPFRTTQNGSHAPSTASSSESSSSAKPRAPPGPPPPSAAASSSSSGGDSGEAGGQSSVASSSSRPPRRSANGSAHIADAEDEDAIQALTSEIGRLHEEQMGFIDQISQLSQKCADVQMAKEQAERDLADSQSKLEESVEQRQAVQASFRELSKRYDEIKDGVVFSKVQENQRQISEARDSIKALTGEVRDAKSENAHLTEMLENLKKDFETLQGHEAKLRESLRERDSANAELRAQVAALESSAAETEQQKRNALAALDRSAKETEDALARARQEHEDALEKARAEATAQSQSVDERFERLESERNALKRKVSSLQKDNRRLQQKHKKVDVKAMMSLQETIERLQEELDRKTKSFENAMEALANPEVVEHTVVKYQRQPPPPSSKPPASSLLQFAGKHSRRLSSKKLGGMAEMRAEERKLTEKTHALEKLANDLSERLQGKEETLRSLRFANAFLGKRVLELEGEHGLAHDAEADQYDLTQSSDTESVISESPLLSTPKAQVPTPATQTNNTRHSHTDSTSSSSSSTHQPPLANALSPPFGVGGDSSSTHAAASRGNPRQLKSKQPQAQPQPQPQAALFSGLDSASVVSDVTDRSLDDFTDHEDASGLSSRQTQPPRRLSSSSDSITKPKSSGFATAAAITGSGNPFAKPFGVVSAASAAAGDHSDAQSDTSHGGELP